MLCLKSKNWGHATWLIDPMVNLRVSGWHGGDWHGGVGSLVVGSLAVGSMMVGMGGQQSGQRGSPSRK
jgi:hypothetical protein